VCVPAFGALIKLVPTRVAFVTALGEAALNGAQAFGPFLGGILYEHGGYRCVYPMYKTTALCSKVTL
jgi:predicted MFS family arabinose efflux permease